MDIGCFEYHSKVFYGSTLNITSHQESMISTMTSKFFLEKLFWRRSTLGIESVIVMVASRPRRGSHHLGGILVLVSL